MIYLWIVICVLLLIVLNNQRIIKSNQVEIHKAVSEKVEGLDRLAVRIDDVLGREGK